MLLYLHIPFCHRICPYCSFYKHTPTGTPINTFIEAISKEAQTRSSNITPTTLYLGGGTPSMLSQKHLTSLFTSLRKTFDFSLLKEITLEANPATFDLSKAKLFKDLGITRVSLGIQSFTSHVIQTLGREHTPQQATNSLHILREAGIPSVNIDLMFSIPGQSLNDWHQTLTHTISLNPDHISAYNLTYEEDTAFFESLKNGTYSLSEDNDATHYHLAEDMLTAAGFEHYETSNYAKPNHHSRHNQGYWQGNEYLGLGPSAVSTIRSTRHRNIPDTDSYIKLIQSLGNAIHESESLTTEQRRIELIALGLRTSTGIPLTLLSETSRQKALQLSQENLITLTDTHIILTQRGRPLVDPIAFELI